MNMSTFRVIIAMLSMFAVIQAANLEHIEAEKAVRFGQDVLTDVTSHPADYRRPVPLPLFYLISATILLAICALVYMAVSEIKSRKSIKNGMVTDQGPHDTRI